MELKTSGDEPEGDRYVRKEERARETAPRLELHDQPESPTRSAGKDPEILLVRDVIRCYEGGERLLMHCNGGLGRAGTMAACVRLALKLDADPKAAIASVRDLRGWRAIETWEQEQFIGQFLADWRRYDP